jgi:hypothetical protein
VADRTTIALALRFLGPWQRGLEASLEGLEKERAHCRALLVELEDLERGASPAARAGARRARARLLEWLAACRRCAAVWRHQLELAARTDEGCVDLGPDGVALTGSAEAALLEILAAPLEGVDAGAELSEAANALRVAEVGAALRSVRGRPSLAEAALSSLSAGPGAGRAT